MKNNVFKGIINKCEVKKMIDLQELRKEIDRIDKSIVELYEERMDICKNVAEFKIATGKKVFDKERENSKIETVKSLANNDFNKQGVEELFWQIMAMSRKLQYQLLTEHGVDNKIDFNEVDNIKTGNPKVVFQGAEGAYSQIAMLEYFGEDVDAFNVETFKDAMETIKQGKADYAVLPIENSTAGSVRDNYDLLVEYDNYIVGEHVVKVEHALLGTPDATLEDIKTVYSHPQALMQCSKYLDENRDWQQISLQNTATSAVKVMNDNDKSQAAIASLYAAKKYGLKVLKEHINYDDANSTRFMIVASKRIFEKDSDKISVCFEIPHESGSLYNALSHFIYNGINMSKIESRPIEGSPWEYRFFVDFIGNFNEAAVKNALRGLEEETVKLKILGNYKKYND